MSRSLPFDDPVLRTFEVILSAPHVSLLHKSEIFYGLARRIWDHEIDEDLKSRLAAAIDVIGELKENAWAYDDHTPRRKDLRSDQLVLLPLLAHSIPVASIEIQEQDLTNHLDGEWLRIEDAYLIPHTDETKLHLDKARSLSPIADFKDSAISYSLLKNTLSLRFANSFLRMGNNYYGPRENAKVSLREPVEVMMFTNRASEKIRYRIAVRTLKSNLDTSTPIRINDALVVSIEITDMDSESNLCTLYLVLPSSEH